MEHEGYWLGVDLGTCVTSAAARSSNSVTMLSLGRAGHDMPSVVAIADGAVLVGEAAHRRGRTEPGSVSREFKRRMGDDTPLLVGGRATTPEWLMSQVLDHVLMCAREQLGAAPDGVTLSHPATWAEHRRRRLREAAALAGVGSVELITEPEAAARFAAENGRLDVGELAAIFDLGGGTFDTALVRRAEATSYDLVGEAIGLDRLGGVDLDEAIFDHVIKVLDLDVMALPDTPAVRASMVQLRDDVVAAKETLSFDTSTVVPVLIEGRQTQVRLNRSEFETLARPFIDKAIDTVELAIAGSGIDPSDIDLIIPVGGTSRVPLVAERLASRLGIAMTETANPRHAVALGAALDSATAASTTTASKTAAATPVAESPSPPSAISGTLTSAAVPLSPLAEPPTVPDRRTDQTVPSALAMAGHSSRATEAIEASHVVDQSQLSETPTSLLTAASTRFLVVGTIAILAVGAIAALWLLDDQRSASTLEASSDGRSEITSPDSGLPADGFEFTEDVGAAQTLGFASPLSDPGPDALPQRLWQNQFSGMYMEPVGHAGLLIVHDVADEGRWASRVVGVDPRSGGTLWSYETPAFLQHFFVGDDGVAVLVTDDGLDADGNMLVVLLDSETGQPTTRLDVTPPAVNTALDRLVGAELVESVLVTTWFDGAELVTSAFDVSAVEPLWQERDPASGTEGGRFGGVGDDSTYVVFGDGALVARDLRTGERLWSTTEVEFFSVRAVSGGIVVLSSVTGRTDYVGYDLRTGDRRWTVANGLAFDFAADGEALYATASDSTKIYSVDLSDGTLRWETRIGSPHDLPIDMVLAGDRIYLLDIDANLAAFDRRNGAAIWSTNVGDMGDSSQLTTAGDALFIQSGQSLVAFG